MDLKHVRQDYTKNELTENTIDEDAIIQFKTWYEEAIFENVQEPNAMVISTATLEGKPSARFVLLKEVTENGFVFFTNYNSQKGKELLENPFACLTFFWQGQERQVRIEGKVEKTSQIISEEYFHSRPKQSQLAASVSNQSQTVNDRAELDEHFEELAQKYAESEVPKPENWGGYILIPERIEFWQGRASRLHDRIKYTKENNHWKIERLAP